MPEKTRCMHDRHIVASRTSSHEQCRFSDAIFFLIRRCRMKNYNERSFLHASRHGRLLSAVLFALALSGCGNGPDRPTPPQAPPKPQVMVKAIADDVQRAVLSYSPNKTIDFQNGKGIKIERRVIHT